MILSDPENPLPDRYQIKFTGALWGVNFQPHIIWLIDFTSRSRIFHLYGDVTIAGEGLQNFDLCLTLLAFEQRGIFIVPHLLCHHGAHLIQIKLLSRDILSKEIFWVCLCTQSYLVLSVFSITGSVNDLYSQWKNIKLIVLHSCYRLIIKSAECYNDEMHGTIR
jgi:hypothetical protein